jgi:aspartate aminotransferase
VNHSDSPAIQISPALERIRLTSKRPTGVEPPPGTINLSMGEPDFAAPAPVVDALHQALLDGHTHYGDLNGDPELRGLIAAQATQVREAAEASAGFASTSPVTVAQVSIGHGATGVLAAAIVALVGPGDRVVLPEPTYSLYSDLVEMVGGEVVWVPLDEDMQLDVAATLDAARGARMLILCNPGNPTGAVFPASALAALGEGLAGTGTLVVSDEAYGAFTYGTAFTSALAVPQLTERLILVDTLSKTYALTGFRLGWSIAPESVAQAISHVGRTIAGAPNAAVQRAGIAALTGGAALYGEVQRVYAERREVVVQELGAVPGVSFAPPEGAFYAFFRHGLEMSSADARTALAERGVLLRAGSEYGPSGEGYLRMSFAASEDDIRTGIRRIAQGLAELRG